MRSRLPSERPTRRSGRSSRSEIFAPLGRDSGDNAIDLVREVQAAMAPVGYSIYKKKERLEEALGLVLDAKARLGELSAPDPHQLAAAHEAEAMALCAEMFYRASLARQESRGWHLREDFPERDDARWLKRILVQDSDGEMYLSTEDVPIHDYPQSTPRSGGNMTDDRIYYDTMIKEYDLPGHDARRRHPARRRLPAGRARQVPGALHLRHAQQGPAAGGGRREPQGRASRRGRPSGTASSRAATPSGSSPTATCT